MNQAFERGQNFRSSDTGEVCRLTMEWPWNGSTEGTTLQLLSVAPLHCHGYPTRPIRTMLLTLRDLRVDNVNPDAPLMDISYPPKWTHVRSLWKLAHDSIGNFANPKSRSGGAALG